MKILTIMGSMRKANTYNVVKRIEEKLKVIGGEDLEFEYLFLKDYKLEYCRGCMICQKKGEFLCPIKDDRDKIFKIIINADGIIFASPVYVEQTSAIMKNFFDRFAYLCHRPIFFDRFAMAIATVAGSSLNPTLNYLERVAILWGYNFVHKFGISETTIKNVEKYTDVASKKIHQALKNKKIQNPGMNRLIEFRILKIVFGKKENPADLEFFKNKRRYYINVRTNLFKIVIPWLIEKFMRKIMNLPTPYNN